MSHHIKVKFSNFSWKMGYSGTLDLFLDKRSLGLNSGCLIRGADGPRSATSHHSRLAPLPDLHGSCALAQSEKKARVAVGGAHEEARGEQIARHRNLDRDHFKDGVTAPL